MSLKSFKIYEKIKFNKNSKKMGTSCCCPVNVNIMQEKPILGIGKSYEQIHNTDLFLLDKSNEKKYQYDKEIGVIYSF